MNLDTLRKVTIVDADRHYAGTATLPQSELLALIEDINSGVRIVHFDKRWDVHEKYLPVHRIAKIEVQDIPGWDGGDY